MNSITIEQLQKAGDKVDIHIESLEGGIYIAYTGRLADRKILYEQEKPLRTMSLGGMQQKLSNIPNASFVLVMTTAYDEMIGAPEESARQCSMPLPRVAPAN